MKGRDTASPETRVAGDYLAAHLFGAGAEPLGETGRHGRTFFQSFPLEVVTPLEAGTELTLILELNGSRRVVPCKLSDDFILHPGGIMPGEVEAPVVFAGYGRVNAETKIDDYQGLNVRNRSSWFTTASRTRPSLRATALRRPRSSIPSRSVKPR